MISTLCSGPVSWQWQLATQHADDHPRGRQAAEEDEDDPCGIVIFIIITTKHKTFGLGP